MLDNIIVIKIGSSSNVDKNLELRNHFIDLLAKDIQQLYSKGDYPILVVSGAVALGMKAYNIKEKPRDVKNLQMCAGCGQGILFQAYQKALKKHNLNANQILVTYKELVDKKQDLYIETGLGYCLKNKSIPIINYNDATDPNEVRQDNDKLALKIAIDSKAKYLILLTDVGGVLDQNKKIIKEIKFPLSYIQVCDKKNVSTGGMESKLVAAGVAKEHRITTIIRHYSYSLESFLEDGFGTIIPAY